MTVYIIARFKIHDRAGYDRYEENFMDVFEPFGGTMLSVDEEPVRFRFQGEFDFTRSCAYRISQSRRPVRHGKKLDEVSRHIRTSPKPGHHRLEARRFGFVAMPLW